MLAKSEMSDFQKKLMEGVEKMPTFPASVQRIVELTSDINSATKDLVEVIENDPILTLKMLKLVNSASFGLSRKITSIKQSVVFIGINTIKNVAVSVAAIGALPKRNAAGFNMNDFWWHSLVCASIARLLAKKKCVPDDELALSFMAALLHDIGQIVLVQSLPEQYKKVLTFSKQKGVLVQDAEMTIFGIEHGAVGAMLAKKWRLSPKLIDCIQDHHHIDGIEQPSTLQMVVFVANQISKFVGGEAHNISQIEEMPKTVQNWLGMSIEEAIDAMPGLQAEIDKAEAFIAISGRGR